MRNNSYSVMRNAFRVVLIVCAIFGQWLLADSGGPYELSWYTIDGGGWQSSGGQYILTGTIGQPDAAYSAGGDYELLGGFWVGEALCFVNFEDFANFAGYWLQSGAGLPADLYKDGTINYDDLLEFANIWLCICPYNWQLK